MKTDVSANQPDWLQDYVDSPERRRKLYRKTLIIVVLSQIFGGAGLAAGITVGALLAQDMLGKDSFAGLPTALFTLGSALAAFLVGRISERYGRRLGIGTGFATGGLGATGVIFAAMMDNVWVLFASLFIYGFGTATNLQARYAGTDLALPHQRATAVSTAMVFTTFGAVAGPNLVNVMGDVALSVGVPALAGPFMLAAAAYLMAGLVIFLFISPDTLNEARADERDSEATSPLSEELSESAFNKKGIMMGGAVMVLTQIVMVAIMTMTPVHMQHHGHGLNHVGMVIGIHVGAMYLPSLVTGILVDKVGRSVMAIAAGVTLLTAGVTAAMAPPDSMAGLMIALGLLGLGWNFGLISGTALIVDSTTLEGRARTQGTVDVLIALAGASGGVLSGMIVANSSYAILSLAGGFLAFCFIPIIAWSRQKQS